MITLVFMVDDVEVGRAEFTAGADVMSLLSQTTVTVGLDGAKLAEALVRYLDALGPGPE